MFSPEQEDHLKKMMDKVRKVEADNARLREENIKLQALVQARRVELASMQATGQSPAENMAKHNLANNLANNSANNNLFDNKSANNNLANNENLGWNIGNNSRRGTRGGWKRRAFWNFLHELYGDNRRNVPYTRTAPRPAVAPTFGVTLPQPQYQFISQQFFEQIPQQFPYQFSPARSPNNLNRNMADLPVNEVPKTEG